MSTSTNSMRVRLLALLAGLACGLAIAAGTAPAAEPATAPAQWRPLGLSGGGTIFHPVVSPHDANTMMCECDMGARYMSYDGGRTWRMVPYSQVTADYRSAAPLFHPGKAGTIYVCTGGTLYVSRDNGQTWAALPAEQQPKVGRIVRFYATALWPDRMFLGAESGQVLFTDDEGKSWHKSQGAEGRAFNFVAMAGGNNGPVIFLGTSKAVYRSDDGGLTFVPKTNGLPDGKTLQGFAGGSNPKQTLLYAATACWLDNGALAGGVYVSKDAGEHWQGCMNHDINVQTTRSSKWASGDLPDYTHLVCNDVDPSRAYVHGAGTSYFPPNHSTIYRTDDAGASWRAVWFGDPRFKECNVALDWQSSYLNQSHSGGRPESMEISPTDPNLVMRTDGMFFFLTRDGGKTWQPAHTRKANDATADKDMVWRNNGLVVTSAWNYYVDPHEHNRHYICYTDIGFARSLDGGQTWRWWGPGGRGKDEEDPNDFPIPHEWINTCYELAFDPDVAGTLWGAFSSHHDIPNENSIWRGTGKSTGKGGICVSSDFGVTWTALRRGLPDSPALSVVVDPKSPKDSRTLYAALYDHGVYKTTDGGKNWVLKSKGLGDADDMRICRIQLHRDGTLFALITGMRVPANGKFTTKGVGLYRSKDGGENWEAVASQFLYPRDFGVSPDDSNLIFIGASDLFEGEKQGGLHRTTDGGKTWELVLRKGTAHFGAYFDPTRKGWVYTTVKNGTDPQDAHLWLSKDNGTTWEPIPGIPFASCERVSFDPIDKDRLFVCTFGGSVWSNK